MGSGILPFTMCSAGSQKNEKPCEVLQRKEFFLKLSIYCHMIRAKLLQISTRILELMNFFNVSVPE